MIMFCMNCVSAGECGGNVARVEGGSVRVGWPGAPGWTTTGVCCADKGVSKAAARSPLFHHGTLIGLCLTRKHLITNGHSLHSFTEALGVFFGRSIYTASKRYSARAGPLYWRVK